tara:strand:+ start:6928 stop:7155 length:228 start_codon:yes stop_codon:yes gene_type:complete
MTKKTTIIEKANKEYRRKIREALPQYFVCTTDLENAIAKKLKKASENKETGCFHYWLGYIRALEWLKEEIKNGNK